MKMNINVSFDVEARCLKFNSINEIKNIENFKKAPEENLTLSLDMNTASNFIFRFAPTSFVVNNKYIVSLKFDEDNILCLICLKEINGSNIFVVSNYIELMSSIIDGWTKIKTVCNVSSFLNYDLQTKIEEAEDEEIIDEFDLPDEDPVE